MNIVKGNLKILITIACIVFFILLLFAYRIYSTPRQKHVDQRLPLGESTLEESEPTRAVNNEIEIKDFAKQNDAADIEISPPDSEPETTTLDSAVTSSPFSERIDLLDKQHRENVKTFITRADLPENLQQNLDRSMEYYELHGHLETNESYIEYMDAPYNEVMEFDLNDPSLMFVTDNLENSALADMEYIGVIPSKVYESPDAPVPEINRVFKHKAGYLYLTEAAMSESGALLQQEFVNKSVKGYPATQMTYCAPSERCVTSLSWLTVDKRYELSLRGDIKHLGENELESIANTLNLPPIPDNNAAEE